MFVKLATGRLQSSPVPPAQQSGVRRRPCVFLLWPFIYILPGCQRVCFGTIPLPSPLLIIAVEPLSKNAPPPPNEKTTRHGAKIHASILRTRREKCFHLTSSGEGNASSLVRAASHMNEKRDGTINSVSATQSPTGDTWRWILCLWAGGFIYIQLYLTIQGSPGTLYLTENDLTCHPAMIHARSLSVATL